MEKEIFIIGVRKLHSTRKSQDYYMVDYVKDDVPKTDYITVLEYTQIANKIKPYTKQIGVFSVNAYDKVYLSNLK